jgi:hypothetical protein
MFVQSCILIKQTNLSLRLCSINKMCPDQITKYSTCKTKILELLFMFLTRNLFVFFTCKPKILIYNKR